MLFHVRGASASAISALKGCSSAFIENRGQWDSRALFLSRTNGLNLWVTSDGLVFDFNMFVPTGAKPLGDKQPQAGQVKGHVVKMSFANARPTAVEGEGLQKAKFNYFLGNDQSKWATKVPGYSQATAQNPYDGISVRYSIEQGAPRYDVIVKPGADPSQVGIKLEGADGARVLPNGNLEIKTSIGTVEERGLTAYQETTKGKTQVPCKLVMDGDTLHFDTGAYDTAKPLVIDPLIFSTFLGGDQLIQYGGFSMDSSGNVVCAGYTNAADFPTTTGAYQTTLSGSLNAVIAKLTSDGSALLFGTYLGGNNQTGCSGVDLDSSNDVFVSGYTTSTNFPTTNGAFQATGNDGYSGFVSELSPDGTALTASTLLGGSSDDQLLGIKLDSVGNVVVIGTSTSRNFPVTNGAFQTSNNSTTSTGTVTKFNPSLTGLVFATYLGGSKTDILGAVAVDSSNNVVVAGGTTSTNFPTTTGAYQTANKTVSGTAFVAKLSANGTALQFGTYLGGTGSEGANAIALDSSANVIVAGTTDSVNFPVTSGAYQATNNAVSGTGFVSKLKSDGTALIFSTLLGGSRSDACNSVALDSANNVAVAGSTSSTNFPTTANAFQTANNTSGSSTGFVSKLSYDGTALVYSSYIGGNLFDQCDGIALDNYENLLVAGSTESADFPTTAGAFQPNLGSASGTLFLSKLGLPAFVQSLSLASSTVASGSAVTAVVELSAPAGSGGDSVSISANPSSTVNVPPTVTVSPGTTSYQFQVGTNSVNSSTPVTITASYEGSFQTATLTVGVPTVSALDISPSTIIGGQQSTGFVFLSGNAGSSGATITMGSSNSGIARAFTPVTVASGSAAAQFNIVSSAVSSSQQITISATYGGQEQTAMITVNPPTVSSITFAPSTITGGNNANGTLQLSGLSATASVTLTSSTSEVTVSNVTVPFGVDSTSISLPTTPASSTTVATITASYNSSHQTTTLTLLPAAISNLAVSFIPPIGGNSATGTVTLAGPAGSHGDVVKLTSTTSEVSMPATVTVPAGQTSVQFSLSSIPVSSNSSTTIKATFGTTSQSITITLLPAPVSKISFSPPSVLGGQTATATITLISAAGAYGNVIKLSTSTAEAPVPATVTVPAGQTSVQVPIQTTAVSSTSLATITTTFGIYTLSGTLTIMPASVSNLTFATNPVVGGQSTMATVMLGSAAGPYGDVVKISSSNGDAIVPATVTVASGQTTANFNINTVAVSSNRTVAITATFGTSSVSKTLTIAPGK